MSEDKPTLKENAIVLALGLLPLALGGALTWFTVDKVQTIKQSRSWPRTEGTVVDATLDAGKSENGPVTYRLRVMYSYEVKGRKLTGDRVSFKHKTFKDKAKADSMLDVYAKGRKIDVYYDPADPSKAVLVRGEAGPAKAVALLGIAVLCLGFVVVVSAFFGHLRRYYFMGAIPLGVVATLVLYYQLVG